MEGPNRFRASGAHQFDLPNQADTGLAPSGKHRIGTPDEKLAPSGHQPISARTSPDSTPLSAGRFSVLVVDDDPAVLSSIEAILSFDFEVVACSSPEEALRRFDPGRFHVVCSDYAMPTMDGRRLLSEILRRSDTVCCLLMTARVELEPMDREFPVVFKPFDPERFVHTVGHLGRIAEMKRSTRALTEATGMSTVPPRSRKP